jgi:hypothetical protein
MSSAVFHRVLSLGCVAAVIAVGLPKVGKPPSALPLVDHGRDSSVNTILQQTLDQPEAARAITQWLAKLPEGRPILVIAAPIDPKQKMAAAVTADTISYLAWPRPVVVANEAEEARKLMPGFRERFAALGLCYMPPPPPSLPQGKLFGPALRFIPSEPVAE